MAARLTRLLVALGLLLGAARPSAAAAVVRPPTSQQIATSLVPAPGADPANARSYFGARYYRASLGRFTTIDPVYTWKENLQDPQRWNRYAYVRNNPLRYIDPDGRIAVDPEEQQQQVLPANPSGLGPDWKETTPHPRSPRRYTNPDGQEYEFHPANPNKSPKTEGGKDHWHEVDRDTGKRKDDHLKPGTPIPTPEPRSTVDDTQKQVVTTIGVGIAGYAAYRVVRLLPSLLPPLWPTILPNVILP